MVYMLRIIIIKKKKQFRSMLRTFCQKQFLVVDNGQNTRIIKLYPVFDKNV